MTHVPASQPVSAVLRQMMVYIAAALALLALTFVVPGVNPYRPPLMDLQGGIAIASYYLTLSGAGNVAPLTATMIVLFLVARPGLTAGRRVKEFLIMFLVVFAVMQVWTRVEPLAKASFQQPRPVIFNLSTQPAGAPLLGMPIDDFYRLSEHPNQRREHLASILTPEFTAIPLDPRIRVHWTGMTDYGFPSGHSVGAMMNAMFLLAMGLTFLPRRWMWVPHLVLVWSVLICYSRPILREHSPTQVLAGGTIGVCLALIAFLIARLLIDKFVEPAGRRATARVETSAA